MNNNVRIMLSILLGLGIRNPVEPTLNFIAAYLLTCSLCYAALKWAETWKGF